MKRMTKLLSLLLIVVMVVGMIPMASAATVEEEISLGQKLADIAQNQVGKTKTQLNNIKGAWCAKFVRYCAQQLGITDATNENGALFTDGDWGTLANPYNMLKNGKAKVYYYYNCFEPNKDSKGDVWSWEKWETTQTEPKGKNVYFFMQDFAPEYDGSRNKYDPDAGDLIYFKCSKTYNHDPWGHVGIITNYNKARRIITFVDGNNSGNGTVVKGPNENDPDGNRYKNGNSYNDANSTYVNELTISIDDRLIMAIAHPFYTTTEGNTYDEALQITSPCDSKTVTVDINKGLNINWTPIESASSYRIAIRDLTSNDGKGTHPDGQFIVWGQNIGSYNVKDLVYEAPNGDVSTTRFKDGHDYRIWVGAYDDRGEPMSYSDQIEFTVEFPEQEEPENPEETPPVEKTRDIVLILDGSGSMSDEEFAKTKQAAEAFAEQVMDGSGKTRIAVMSFGSENFLFKINSGDDGFYNTLADVKTAISNGTRDYGATYIGDALLFAQKLLSGSTAEQQVIMLMSDGEANGATNEAWNYGSDGAFANYWANNALNVAKHIVEQDDITIYTLGFGLYQGEAETLLKDIAALNGGSYQAVDDVEDLVFGFTENAGDIITSGNQILIIIACPVNVYVDYGGEALSSAPDWPSYMTGFGSLTVSSDGEIKTLRLDADNEYDIEIYGTDEGSMTVTAKYPGEEKEEVLYEDVPVTSTMSAYFCTENSENTTMYYDGDGDGEFEDEIEGEKNYNGVAKYDVTYMVEDEVYEVDSYAEGETIVPPDDPELDGYTFEGWEDLPETMPAEDIAVTALWEKEREGSPFIDIIFLGSGSNRAIEYVYENGLFEGVSRNEFAPHMTMTRGMFVTVLGRMAGINEEAYYGSSFSDVQAGEWYAPGVAWASQNGIVKGYGDGTFGVNDEVTVEQAVVILARYAEYLGIDTASDYLLTKFSDRNHVSAWAFEQMQWAVEQGVYDGNGKSLVPQKSASRELVATLIYNFAMEYVE